MWQETKHGLYKQFNFKDFKEAWAFMGQVASLAEAYDHHPRWENEWSVVQIWLITHEGDQKITELDRRLAEAIDNAAQPNSLPNPDRATLPHDKVKLFADGGSRGNPGPSASGYVLLDTQDKVLCEKGVYLGVTTNNQAEYQSLKLALEEAKRLQSKEVEVYMDSMLVINQMKGIYKVKNRDLWPIHDSIKKLCSSFRKVSFSQVPREFNKIADAAVNKALDRELDKTNS